MERRDKQAGIKVNKRGQKRPTSYIKKYSKYYEDKKRKVSDAYLSTALDSFQTIDEFESLTDTSVVTNLVKRTDKKNSGRVRNTLDTCQDTEMFCITSHDCDSLENLSEEPFDEAETSDNVDSDCESDCESENENSEHVSAEEPIQPGHVLSTNTSILLIWLFIMKHSLTSTQISDLLLLINLHLLIPNPALKSIYRFKKHFSNMKSSSIRHFYCPNCYCVITEEAAKCNTTNCLYGFDKSVKKPFFLEIPIKHQLENLFRQKEFVDGLRHKSRRIKKNDYNIEDIYDSEIYKSLSRDGGPLSECNKYNLSFVLNTDGVPVFKSSKRSIWPIFLVINELPFTMRKQQRYMILCGLWYGEQKPIMNTFLTPVIEAMKKMEQGIELLVLGEMMKIKAYLLGLSCDIPARSAVLNMNQHNGASCCPKCIQTGMNHRTKTGGNVRVFPYMRNSPVGPQRIDEGFRKDSQKSFYDKTVTNGIKGPTIMMLCPKFNLVRGVAIDYMHAICLGVVRLLLNLWFSASNTSEAFSLAEYIGVVDKRISKIKPTYFISRTPRTLSDNLKFWKAAELRSWLLYYSIPCLYGLMKPLYFYHYCAFIEAVCILCQSSISHADILRSERLLQYFVFMMTALYGERYVTINIHSLLHMPQSVRDLGPLWAVSCFPFENANGQIMQFFHGTQYVDTQICNAVQVYQQLPSITGKLVTSTAAKSLLNSLLKRDSAAHTDTLFHGKSYSKTLEKSVQAKLCGYFDSVIKRISFFNRATVRGTMFHSLDYNRVSKRNSYTVKYLDEKGAVAFGIIEFFGEQEGNKFVCIREFFNAVDIFDTNISENENMRDQHVEENFLKLCMPHMRVFKITDRISVVPLQNLLDLCIYVEIDQVIFLFEEPNHYETNL